jgi:hypothetical protein
MRPPLRNTSVRSASKKSVIREAVARHCWTRIGEVEWNVLTSEIAGLSTSDLRHAGIPADPPWSGVAQATFDELDASLGAFTAVYADREDLRRFCRAEVIRAKDRARLASRNTRVAESKRAMKAEMVELMLVWLGDPAIYPVWSTARKNARV